MTAVCQRDRGIFNETTSVSSARFQRTESRPTGLHVLTLTPFYPLAEDSAAGCFISEPLPWLQTTGIRSDVLAVRPFYRGRTRSSVEAHPAIWMHYPALPRGYGLATSGRFLFARISRAVRLQHGREPFHLIHAHGALPCGHAALLLARQLGIPFVVSVHGRDAFSSRQVSGLAGQWCARISQNVYRFAKQVIGVSRKVAEEVLSGVDCDVSVVYNGVDTKRFTPAPASEDSSPVILSIGNLLPTKGQQVLLHAIAGIHDLHPALRCKIIGTGPEYCRLLRRAKELGLADRVEFLGRQSRESVAHALRRCTVFVLTSSYEALGCVYLEAMATAKVAVGCTGQGIEEVIMTGENGWLVEPDNPQALATGLHTLLSNVELRARLGAAARRTVLERFTLVHQAEQLARIYQECAA